MRWPTASARSLARFRAEYPDVAAAGAGRGRRRRRQREIARRRSKRCAREHGFRFVAPPHGAVHRQCGDDRLGRHRALARRARRTTTPSISCRARAGRSTAFRRRSSAPAGGEPRHERPSRRGAWRRRLGHRAGACRCAARRARRPAVGARRRGGRGDHERGENPRYLPGDNASTPASRRRPIIAEALDGADCVLVVDAGAGAARCCSQAAGRDLPAGVPLVLCAKGIERDTGMLLSRDRRRNPARQSGRRAVRPELRDRCGAAACRPRWSSPRATRRWRPTLARAFRPSASAAIRPATWSASRSAAR